MQPFLKEILPLGWQSATPFIIKESMGDLKEDIYGLELVELVKLLLPAQPTPAEDLIHQTVLEVILEKFGPRPR